MHLILRTGFLVENEQARKKDFRILMSQRKMLSIIFTMCIGMSGLYLCWKCTHVNLYLVALVSRYRLYLFCLGERHCHRHHCYHHQNHSFHFKSLSLIFICYPVFCYPVVFCFNCLYDEPKKKRFKWNRKILLTYLEKVVFRRTTKEIFSYICAINRCITKNRRLWK